MFLKNQVEEDLTDHETDVESVKNLPTSRKNAERGNERIVIGAHLAEGRRV